MLAEETASYRHYAKQDLRIAVLDGEITITLDDEALFGGPVTDDAPLDSGSVGVLTQSMNRVEFDNITVNTITLAARALTADKDGRWLVDLDGDGSVVGEATAHASLSAEGIASYEWLVDDAVVANGISAALDLAPGETTVTLRVTDNAGAVSGGSDHLRGRRQPARSWRRMISRMATSTAGPSWTRATSTGLRTGRSWAAR